MKHGRAPRAGRAGRRPAGASPASGSGKPRWLGQVPYLVVLLGVVAGLALMRGGAHSVRSGTLVMASALLIGSVTRLVTRNDRAGLLASRWRLLDAAALAALGVGLLVAGLIVKVPG